MKQLRKIAVECRNIGLSYDGGKTEVLKDINLRIEPGEFFALLGPSGSGKSTLLRLIAGFNQHQRGQLLVDGKDITGVPPHARNIGMVFQSYALWPHMTVWDNVAFGLVERRMDKATIRQKVGAALELVGLAQYANRRPNQLSGGQQQRVALARTIVIEPQVLLLDEPLSNLDKKLRVQMREELRSLQRTLGITTVFVTHDQEEAMTTADRMAVMDKGVVQQLGTPAVLFDYPVNPFVANFVGTTNLLTGDIEHVNGDTLRFRAPGIGEIILPKHPEARTGRMAISFRPHTIRMAVGDAVRDGAYVWLNGAVEQSEFLGEFTRYRVRVGEAVITADQSHFSGTTSFAPSASVRLGIDTSQIRYLPV
ncbi:ABC transporter ATP-binding protein [Noviherbaspirillum massiliense]|uniref:ABC transporter ATP-binding protein n=1 Tax=Noviherbaspirillum massiliense TaxID=1465823 RepID=UPI0002EC3CFE|nr:ABC transporter ATP-binding protein [Noviherbaspirillum massiliense]